jgi:GNAT superfamily N-acetyltransferase
MIISVGNEYLVRSVQKTEAEKWAILAVYHLCEDFLALGPCPVASMTMVEADLEISENAHADYCGIYLGETGKMVGVMDILPTGFEGDARSAYIELLMIASPFRGQGLGRDVVNHLEIWLKANFHIHTLYLSCQVNNPKGLGFWQWMGFQICGEAQKQEDGTTAILMRRPVSEEQSAL